MQASYTQETKSKHFGRSAISNGTKLHDRADGRSREARRFRDLVNAYSRDLGGRLNEAQTAQVRQVAGVTVQAEVMQAAIVRGETVDADQLVRVSNLLSRLIAGLGPLKSSTPAPNRTLADHLAERNAGA